MISRWAVLLLGVALGSGPQPRAHTVEIRGMGFDPAVLSVSPGDTVIWINRDIVPHTATAVQRAEWDTGLLQQGQSGRIVATVGDTIRYVCGLHPTMRGTLVIRERTGKD